MRLYLIAACLTGTLVLGSAAAAGQPKELYCSFFRGDPPSGSECSRDLYTDARGRLSLPAVPIPKLQFRFVSFGGTWSARGKYARTDSNPSHSYSYSFSLKDQGFKLRPTKRARGVIQLAGTTFDPRYYRKRKSPPTPFELAGWESDSVSAKEEWQNLPDLVDGDWGDRHTGDCTRTREFSKVPPGVPGWPEFVLLRGARVKVELDFAAGGALGCFKKYVRGWSGAPAAPWFFALRRTYPLGYFDHRVVRLRWSGHKHETRQELDGDRTQVWSGDWSYSATLVVREA